MFLVCLTAQCVHFLPDSPFLAISRCKVILATSYLPDKVTEDRVSKRVTAGRGQRLHQQTDARIVSILQEGPGGRGGCKCIGQATCFSL